MKSLTALFAYLSFASFWDTVDRVLFTPNFDTYEHMTFFNSPNAFKLLVLGMYFGVVIASLCMLYNKRFIGDFIRKLDTASCLSEQGAKTLDELWYGKNVLIKRALEKGNLLRNIVKRVEPKDDENANNSARSGGYRKNRIDFETARFYIPAEKRDVVIGRFDAKGSTWLSVILTAVIGLIAVIIIFKIAPSIVGLIDTSLSSFSNEPDVLN